MRRCMKVANIKMEETTNKTCSVNAGANEGIIQANVKPKRAPVDKSLVIKDVVCNVVKNKNTVIVSNKCNFKALLMKCEKLLDNDAEEIYIHGLGAAVNKACNLALQLQENHQQTLELDITTSTVKLIDNILCENDDDDITINERLNSAIQIRVYRKIPVTSLKFQK